MTKRLKIQLTGRVQGIGFRPAVYRLAAKLHLAGLVYNDTKGVTIEIQGLSTQVNRFLKRLKTGGDLPALSDIKSLQTEDINPLESETGFTITQSDPTGTPLSQVTADIATCPDCLREMRDQNDFRFNYPFINCTNCGPRYSIVKTIPYDRPNTTMSPFVMCDRCASQYRDVNDRRFHAQPVACPNCGPKIRLTDSDGKTIETDNAKVIAAAAQMLKDGKVLAIKGIGGFHLAANALDNEAVLRLRNRKKRDHKPFAMMADTIDKIKKYAKVDQLAEKILKSPESPIVLLPKIKNCRIASAAAESVNTFGFMLCYAPLHYLLFAQGLDVLVMTSGNISDEPLICKNDKALELLGDAADAFIMHDREIYRQVDDSIVHFINGEPVLLRRARGYVPTPIITETSSDKNILATGSDLKNTFCYVKANQMIVSEHIGDMEDANVYHHYIESVKHLAGLFEIEPKVIACDLHPGYFSTAYAESLKDVEIIRVQHHWAHIASVLAEHGLDKKVIGLGCDGTGYGTDGAVWGCECMIADLENFERIGHLMYYPLPGGDIAAKEAVRPAIALLDQAYGDDFNLDDLNWLLKKIDPDTRKHKVISEQIKKGLNTISTSSLGRVFDAVAAIVGLGNYNNFQAQLPIALEAAIDTKTEKYYDFDINTDSDGTYLLDLRKMFRQIIDDVRRGASVAIVSVKFHNCLARGLLELAKKARQKTDINTVTLSGGVFCNRYLTNRLIMLLNDVEFRVLFNRIIPSNDGGISLGQAQIALKRFSRR